MKLVFATNNKHKLDEMRAILGDKVELLSLADIDCHDDIPETADTLEGNALIHNHCNRSKIYENHNGEQGFDSSYFIQFLSPST